jgi:hypothetical protein
LILSSTGCPERTVHENKRAAGKGGPFVLHDARVIRPGKKQQAEKELSADMNGYACCNQKPGTGNLLLNNRTLPVPMSLRPYLRSFQAIIR